MNDSSAEITLRATIWKFLCFIEETVRGMCDYHDTKSDNNWDIITAQLRFISLFTQQLIFTNQNISLK